MNEKILEALDFVDERFVAGLEDAAPSRAPRLRRMAVLAVAAALLFTVSAAAAGWFDLSAWFSRRWQEQTGQPMAGAQTALLADLSRELDMTAVDGGLRVTAEEITVGQNGVTVLLSARLEEGCLDGQKFYAFDPLWSEVKMEPEDRVCGFGFDFVGFDAATGTAYIAFEYDGFSQTEAVDRVMQLSLYDLVYCTESEAPLETAVDGVWTFTIPVSLPEEPLLLLGDAVVTAEGDGGETPLRLRDLQLSGTGLRFWHDVEQNYSLPLPELIFFDGSALRCYSGSGSRNEEKQRFEQIYGWSAPLDPAEVTAIRFGDDVISIP